MAIYLVQNCINIFFKLGKFNVADLENYFFFISW